MIAYMASVSEQRGVFVVTCFHDWRCDPLAGKADDTWNATAH
jgi:hypothetical protein